MRWTERQRAMLREMGVRLWLPDDAGAADADDATGGVAVATPAATRTEAAPTAPQPRVAERTAAGPTSASQRLPGLAAADWLVVGEPLDEADPQQAQLLVGMLRAIGVGLVAPGREQRAVYFAVDPAATAGDTARARADAAPLRKALDTVAPRCLLALGRAAAAALLGAEAPLGGLRGRVHAHAGVPVVVTFSLAFLLRHPAEKAKAWADLCLAVASMAPRPDAASA